MTDGDDKLKARYRALPGEEPSPDLDRAILAASRRAVAPKGVAQRWAVPVSLAAVLVLAVGVTLRMQQESPGIETTAPASEYRVPPTVSGPAPPSAPATTTPLPPAAPAAADAVSAQVPRSQEPVRKALPAKPAGAEAPRELRADSSSAEAPMREKKATALERNVEPPPVVPQPKAFADAAAPSPAARASAAAPAPPPAAARVESQATAGATPPPPQAFAPAPKLESSAGAAPTAQAREKRDASANLAKEPAKDPLERELQRIAQLRREGRQAEADEALEKFRRENPAYRIPEAIWEQVRPR